MMFALAFAAIIHNFLSVPFMAIPNEMDVTRSQKETRPNITLLKDLTLLQSYPHDRNGRFILLLLLLSFSYLMCDINFKAFTQGLAFYKGSLFESTGMYGKSSLREVDLSTGF